MPKAKSIEFIRELVEKKDGYLLSDFYQNCNTPLKIKCKNNHIWVTKYNSLRKGCWCIICVRRITIGHAQKIALKRGGKCLSKAFKGSYTKLEWECKYGHIWKALYKDVKSKSSWCPSCSTGLYERLCRQFLEQVFNKKFPTKRPGWLLNSRNNRMELDGYCEELGLAFEHNGKYHYEDIPFFTTKLSFEGRKKDDLMKISLCKDKGVKLIIIPELYTILPIKKLKNHLRNEFIKLNIDIPSKFDEVDVNKINLNSSKIDELKKIAIDKGGELISKVYLGANYHLTWSCNEGHHWKATPAMVKFQTWCPQCYENRRGDTLKKHSINTFRKLALQKGGKCLSLDEDYDKLNNSRLKFVCNKGHEWLMLVSTILYKKSWCPKCAKIQKKRSKLDDYY